VNRYDEEEYDGNMNNYHHNNNHHNINQATRNHLQTLNNHANNNFNESHNTYQNKATPNNSAINTSNINSNNLNRSSFPPQLSLINPQLFPSPRDDRNDFNNTDVTRNPDHTVTEYTTEGRPNQYSNETQESYNNTDVTHNPDQIRVNYNEISAASQLSPGMNYNEKVPSPYSDKVISPVENKTKSQIFTDFGEFDTVTEYATEGRPIQYNQTQESYDNEQDVMEYNKRSVMNMIQSEQIDNSHLIGNICIYVCVYINIYIYINLYIYIYVYILYI
jgi:hypothetical protein